MAISVKGKTVVLTGVFADMERSEAEKKLEKKGARCTGSVSNRTDMLFAGKEAGSKIDTAESLGIPIYGEKDLFAIVGKPKAKPKKVVKPPTKAAKKKVAARTAAAGPGLAGKTVVVTGTLSKPRAAVEALLRKAGAKVTGSVSANTHYLVCGVDAGTKLATAKLLGVPVVLEAMLADLLKGKAPAASVAGGEEE